MVCKLHLNKAVLFKNIILNNLDKEVSLQPTNAPAFPWLKPQTAGIIWPTVMLTLQAKIRETCFLFISGTILKVCRDSFSGLFVFLGLLGGL